MNQLFDLKGKVAIVTGGNGGLGLGMAMGLAGAGADVAVVARNREKTGQAVSEIGSLGVRAVGTAADLTIEADVRRAVCETIDALGRVDILVNNAGTVVRKEPHEISTEEWDQVLDLNLKAAFLMAKEVYPHMKSRGGGKVVNIGSMTSIFGGGGSGVAYSASKGGIVQLSKSLAVAWAPDNIQSNAILPGWFMTTLISDIPTNQPERFELISRRIPAGRWGETEELQGAVVFLSSRASDYVTGAVITVDGGYSVLRTFAQAPRAR